mgnify:CR=1 FL=1
MRTNEVIKNVKKLEIRTRRTVDHLTAGAYHSVFKGRGMEFEEVREYAPGDDVRTIDWNVTARFGHPYVKKFVEERELTVLLLVDISASGDFGSLDKSKNELAAEIAALLAFSAERNNDRIGLLLFSGEDELFVSPRKGRRHTLRLIRELVACQRKNPQTNIRHALETTMKLTSRRAIVFLISDMLDSGYERVLSVANNRHDVVALRMTDPREINWPNSGFVNVADAESPDVQTAFRGASRKKLQQYNLEATALRTESEQACRRAGVDMIDLTCGSDPVKPLMQFFRLRERRRRHS